MRDKAVARCSRALAPVAALTICTTAPTPRAMEAAAIGELARSAHAQGRDRAGSVRRGGARLRSGTPGRRGRLDLPRSDPVRERLARDILR